MRGAKTPSRCENQSPVTIIVNPKAGGFSRKRMDRILARLEMPVNIIETGFPGHARAIVRDLSPGIPVFVAGGDGTINEVVNGLMDARTLDRAIPAMGIIPIGTANVLAHELQIKNSLQGIVDYIHAQVEVDVSPGMANGSAFMLMAGAGPDAVTVANVSARLKTVLGKWAYVWQGVCTIMRPPDTMIDVKIGDDIHRTAGVIVTRARHYGGPYVLSPDAGLLTSKLVVVLLTSNRVGDLLRYAVCLVVGKLAQQPDVHVVSGTEMTLTCAGAQDHKGAGMPLQIDGDLAGKLPCNVILAPHAIRLMVPDYFKQPVRP
ncbi:diacylglycerol/lipid kinase family protein [Thalassospira lucentensis]|uniref:diacylglycerol/lipid kinase family protein n=1 Tax=Thalassospira lucentensis TaxID=168935 RepID=UPI003D2EDA6A